MSNKSPEMEKILNEFAKQAFGRERTNDRCVMCGNTNLVFRNALSEKEFKISRMCQKCQDSVFGID